jgi:predicted RNase H-like nuclease
LPQNQEAMIALGVDSCRAGWCVAAIGREGKKIDIKVTSNFRQAMRLFPPPDAILIDIPLGLGDRLISRDVEKEARKVLAPLRHGSIFTPPVREAVNASTYTLAKEINRAVTGQKISIQSWNISGKIAEIDEFIQNDRDVTGVMREAHPEICFKYLNRGMVPSYPKKAPNNHGIWQRLQILARYQRTIHSEYKTLRRRLPAAQVGNDDIVDAVCLAIAARLGLQHGFCTIEGSHTTDSRGIKMGMHYFDPVTVVWQKRDEHAL